MKRMRPTAHNTSASGIVMTAGRRIWITLFSSQGVKRVHANSAPRGQVCREHRAGGKDYARNREGKRVMRAEAVQCRAHEVHERVRRNDSNYETNGNDARGLSENHRLHGTWRSTERHAHADF